VNVERVTRESKREIKRADDDRERVNVERATRAKERESGQQERETVRNQREHDEGN